VIYERAVFNRINQNDSDSVDDFITRPCSEVDKCRYGDLRDEMIKDKIVVSIKDKSLSEKLQLDLELTLERAVTQVRNAELVKLQQKDLQESHHPKIVERVQSRPRNNSNSKRCLACGYWCLENQHRCPAVSARCYQCGMSGHFRRLCNVYVSSIERNDTESVSDKGYFVGTLQNARAWDKPVAWIRVNGTALHFRIDSGADVTVIPHDDFKRLPNTCLSKSLLVSARLEKTSFGRHGQN